MKILLLSAALFFGVYYIPFMMNIYVDTIVRSVIFAGLFIPAILLMKVSEELNLTARNMVKRVLKFDGVGEQGIDIGLKLALGHDRFAVGIVGCNDGCAGGITVV